MIHDKLSNEIWDYFNKLINVAYPIFSTFKGYVSLPRRTKLRPLAERKENDLGVLKETFFHFKTLKVVQY